MPPWPRCSSIYLSLCNICRVLIKKSTSLNVFVFEKFLVNPVLERVKIKLVMIQWCYLFFTLAFFSTDATFIYCFLYFLIMLTPELKVLFAIQIILWLFRGAKRFFSFSVYGLTVFLILFYAEQKIHNVRAHELRKNPTIISIFEPLLSKKCH